LDDDSHILDFHDRFSGMDFQPLTALLRPMIAANIAKLPELLRGGPV